MVMEVVVSYRDALDFCLDSSTFSSKAASEFDIKEVAKLFPGVKHSLVLENECKFRCLACLWYVSSPRKFEWIVSIVKEYMEMGILERKKKMVTIPHYFFPDNFFNEEDFTDDRDFVTEPVYYFNPYDMGKLLYQVSIDYEGQDQMMLIKFADYMSNAFCKANKSQFMWLEMVMESSFERMACIPLYSVSISISDLTKGWLKKLSVEALECFVLTALESIFSDLSAEKAQRYESSKIQAGTFLVLAMILRFKPDIMMSVWPTLEGKANCRVHDKIRVLAWVLSQAVPMYWVVGDWMVGVFMWVKYLFPLLSKSDLSLESRAIIMQLIDRIGRLENPCVDLVVRNGERVVPPEALEPLARAAFPINSTQEEATEALRGRYPLLKKVALCCDPGSEVAKQISEQLIPFAIKAAGEGNSSLAEEARKILFWCLTNNPQGSIIKWGNMCRENLNGSLFILEELSVKGMEMMSNNCLLSVLEPLKTLTNQFEKALEREHDAARRATLLKAKKLAQNTTRRATRVKATKLAKNTTC